MKELTGKLQGWYLFCPRVGAWAHRTGTSYPEVRASTISGSRPSGGGAYISVHSKSCTLMKRSFWVKGELQGMQNMKLGVLIGILYMTDSPVHIPWSVIFHMRWNMRMVEAAYVSSFEEEKMLRVYGMWETSENVTFKCTMYLRSKTRLFVGPRGKFACQHKAEDWLVPSFFPVATLMSYSF